MVTQEELNKRRARAQRDLFLAKQAEKQAKPQWLNPVREATRLNQTTQDLAEFKAKQKQGYKGFGDTYTGTGLRSAYGYDKPNIKYIKGLKKGGPIKTTGIYKLHRGEYVIPRGGLK